MKKIFLAAIFAFFLNCLFSQQDKGKFVTYPFGFYENEIMKSITGKSPDERNVKTNRTFIMDFEGKKYPVDINKYKTVFHNNPISQGNSGTCWAYAATSFIESEIYRKNNIKVKLSELYVVYCEYLEKAQAFVNTKGNTFLGEGSEPNAILRIMSKYGLMPQEAYNGLHIGEKFNNHSEMFNEIKLYFQYVKNNNLWDENTVIKHVKIILDKYIGTVPATFTYQGKEYDAKKFADEYLKIKTNEYYSFMSTKELDYNQKAELIEPDNWWHEQYYNVSLDDFIFLINNAITNGYSVSICGDVSEAGYDKFAEVAVVPDFDIPQEYINEDSRYFRLDNNSTNDDHCIHIVGYQEINNERWYLVKDSGSGAFDGQNKGYRFYREDYIKLKMINTLIHVDVCRKVLNKIIK